MLRPLSAALLLAASGAAAADEGMWTYNNFPKQKVLQAYGWAPTDEWLTHLQRSSVRFNNGGSGSFVSADGLILTNHHVAADCIQKLSRQDTDLISAGFVAADRAHEIACPDLEINVLQSIETVTDQVNAAVTPTMSGGEAYKAQREAMSRLEKACAEQTGLRCDVVTLYAGAQFDLYRYQRYTDVRLAFAPEFDIAFFGGDPENFTFPRYDLDAALFRAYQGGAPSHPPHYLRTSGQGARDGELVFVSGHPGTTNRRLTVAQLEFLRDVAYPLQLATWKEQRDRLRAFAKKGPEPRRIAQKDIFGLENRMKARTGMLSGLRDPALVKRKRSSEEELKKLSAALPNAGEVADAFVQIAAVQKKASSLYRDYALFELAYAFPGQLFGVARALLRRSEELQKPNEERLREFRESNLLSVDQTLFSPAPVYPELEVEKLACGLELLSRERGASDALVKQVLGGRTPRQAAEHYVKGSALAIPAARKELAGKGLEAIRASADPMLVLARMVDPEARRLRKVDEDEIDGVERKHGAVISRALFALEGHDTYPDATFTLRLSYGQVKGYRDGEKEVAWATTMGGLYQHATGKPPLELPRSFLAAQAKVDPKVPLNFISTNDSTGGNSGSPVVNANGALVGLIFDSNLPGLPNVFVYSSEKGRAVSMHSAAIVEALRKVYGAGALADELLGVAPAAVQPAPH